MLAPLPADSLGIMRLTGWRYGAFVGGFVGCIGVCCYASMIRPMLNPEPYSTFPQIINKQLSVAQIIIITINVFQRGYEIEPSRTDLHNLILKICSEVLSKTIG